MVRYQPELPMRAMPEFMSTQRQGSVLTSVLILLLENTGHL